MSEDGFARITDEALAALRSRLGQEIPSSEVPYLEEACKDGLRHWARGIGDRNRLWTDEEYARQTRWGGIIAPPTILYAFTALSIGYRGGLPGIHAFFGGSDHEWYLPIRRNDEIKVKVVFSDLVEHKSKFAGRSFQQISEVTFTNQRGEVVAVSHPWGFRTERDTAVKTGKYYDVELATYTPEDIARITEEYDREEIRGGEPRYWEDVREGDELPTVIRGPWSPTTSIAFLMGHGGMFVNCHGFLYDYLKRHPKAGIPNELGIPEGPVRGHWDTAFARRIGVPAAYDYGPERIGWLGTLLTNWMGDDGFLRRLYVEVRGFNLIGDLTHLHGRVVEKAVVDGQHRVKVEIEAVNQRNRISAKGFGEVELPSRGGNRPIPRPLP